MTTVIDPQQNRRQRLAQAESPAGGTMEVQVTGVVPSHLLDGDEVVHFAIKPSPWFVILTSLRWLTVAAVLAFVVSRDFFPTGYRFYAYQLVAAIAGLRLLWATLEWVARLYVLTDRRVMRIQGVFNVELFECALDRIQNTYATFSIAERITRVGTISFQTAAAGEIGGTASWLIVSRPLEVYEKLRDAIRRAQNRGSNGL